MAIPFRRTTLRVALAVLVAVLGACSDDPIGPAGGSGGQVGVVLNSLDLTLTIFPVDTPSVTRTVALAAAGSPVGLAVRGALAAVPMGLVPAVVLVDVVEGRVLEAVPLPAGSGATGVAFLSDTLVLVGNPGVGTVSPVHLPSGTAGDPIAAGTYPHGIVVSGDRVGVLDARLGPDFLPEGPGRMTVLDRETLETVGTVQLSGYNPGDAAVGPGGLVYVVHSGTFGAGNGSVSVVDLGSATELAHHEGFGEFPFAAAIGPEGRLHVGSFGYGVVIWDPATESFARPPGAAVAPGGVPSVSGLGFDASGRLYTLLPECSAPASAYRLDGTYGIDAEVSTGVCPIDLGFGGGGG